MAKKTINKKQDIQELGSIRSGFGRALSELGKFQKNVVVLCADLTDSLKAGDFAKKYPKRFFQMGICEQNMMGAAAGMCLMGKVPFVLSYGAFNPGRNWDQLRVSVAYSNANVKVVGGHCGLTTGPDGATHQMLEDFALTCVLPNMTVVVPCDEEQAYQATKAIAKHNGPCYLRLSREQSKHIISPSTSFTLGKAQVLKRGSDITIISTGITVQFALEAYEQLLEKDIHASIINIHTLKPLDVKTIERYAKNTKAILVVEEHQKMMGLGSMISQHLSEKCPTLVSTIGVQDSFGESGKGYELLEKYGISTRSILLEVEKLLSKKKLLN
jgi:transketolase